MRERLLELAERRAHLQARALAEREALASQMSPADGVAAAATAVLHAAQRGVAEARRHPLIMVVGVALLVALRPRRALGWLVRGWSLWRLYRGALGWWLRFSDLAGPPAGHRK